MEAGHDCEMCQLGKGEHREEEAVHRVADVLVPQCRVVVPRISVEQKSEADQELILVLVRHLFQT